MVKDYKFSVFGGRIAVVEGHKGIVEYNTERVSFALKTGVLRVCGEDLRIKGLEKNFAVVEGIVRCVEVENEK